MNLSHKRQSSPANPTPDERIGRAVKTIRRKYGRAAIRYGREGVAQAVAVFGKRRPGPPRDGVVLIEIVAVDDDVAVQG